MSDQEPSRRCTVCDGRGYLRCDCWPGDCICGWDDEECEYCEGTGYIEIDEVDAWDGIGSCPKCQGDGCDHDGGCRYDE